ncbi:uncharacterized protein LOC118509375 [Anopheles stephensi]|uniref:uncharacterized protein LOC118509375 n=1 Tax=Anopheles stephensi TaxID=30069 RepID=UPI001658896F|nr:uncharacterized protein LOC118509375 [Anopheles stephensi]
MMFRKTSILGATVVILSLIIATNCSTSPSALDIILQKLCVCPCGNPRGGKLYTVSSERLNWFDAVAYCNSIGMSIVTIKDANDRRLLQLHLEQTRRNLRSQSRSQIPYWIGANTLAGSGIRWGLTDQEVNQPEWNPASAPTGNQLSEPFCVYIQGDTMRWIRAPCDNESRQFICEY